MLVFPGSGEVGGFQYQTVQQGIPGGKCTQCDMWNQRCLPKPYNVQLLIAECEERRTSSRLHAGRHREPAQIKHRLKALKVSSRQ